MRVPIAREGYPFIAVFAAATVLLGGFGFGPAALVTAVLAVACAAFFRDPERAVPDEPGAIVSPADGRVVAVAGIGTGSRISVFLSVFDVHVNRSPIAGRVGVVSHRPGRFLAAFNPKASEVNEQTSVPLTGDRGTVEVRQIAGLIARRIVCRVREGDALESGQRFGLIRFGSRVDIFLPGGASPVVRRGDRVRGGSSVIARWDASREAAAGDPS